MLRVKNVSYYAGQTPLVQDVSFEASAGEMITIVGANGAGKTTLLRMIAGDLKPASGTIELHKSPLTSYTVRQLALQRAMMPQQPTIAFGFTAYDVVMMGRYPHRNSRSAHNRMLVNEILERTGTTHLRDQLFSTLSGGEQARVTLARVLVQETPLLLLDEPTSALDLRHQQMALALARQRTADGNTVIAILHDLNLAALYADRIVMMKNGRLMYMDTPTTVLTPENIENVFGLSVQVMPHPARDVPLVVPLQYQEKIADKNAQG